MELRGGKVREIALEVLRRRQFCGTGAHRPLFKPVSNWTFHRIFSPAFQLKVRILTARVHHEHRAAARIVLG
jgi:hypothetical protein